MSDGKQALMAEFQFVQRYLFSIPKLRAMVKANQALARWLSGASDAVGHPNLGLPVADSEKCVFNELGSLERALLKASAPDRPLANLGRGVLASAGGHFEAIVTEPEQGKAILRQLLREHVPGLDVGMAVGPIDLEADFRTQDIASREAIAKGKFHSRAAVGAVMGHPFMEVCQLTGTDPAVSRHHAFENQLNLGERATQFLKSNPARDAAHYDPAAFVENCLCLAQSGSTQLPQEFSEFFPGSDKRRFLAVIAIDGNKVGQGLKEFQARELEKKTYGQGAVLTELFFYRLRLLMRVALTCALQDTASLKPFSLRSDEKSSDIQVLPVRVLMLGGDDALVVIPANCAFDFIQEFSKWWDRLLGEYAGEGLDESQAALLRSCRDRFGAFTFKAGMALVPYNYPFHAAHALATDLESEAKKASERTNLSCVDWHVLFSSTPESVAELRSREYLERYILNGSLETLELTERPYPITSAECAPTLKSQWAKAMALHDAAQNETRDTTGVARSKLKLLRSLTHIGRREADILLEEIKIASKDKVDLTPCFTPAKDRPSLTYRTGVLDILEMYDLLIDRDRAESESRKEGL